MSSLQYSSQASLFQSGVHAAAQQLLNEMISMPDAIRNAMRQYEIDWYERESFADAVEKEFRFGFHEFTDESF